MVVRVKCEGEWNSIIILNPIFESIIQFKKFYSQTSSVKLI